MCGIAGVFVPRQAASPSTDLDAMAAAMRHRGPDGDGRWISADRRYQGTFVRLAIIDLATGDQPLVDGDGRRVLMGNGEIYNYLELRAENAGYPYRTRGDMEVVLALAERTGDRFVEPLNGMYALALHDSAEHRLVLVRDRLGVKPLYWARLPGGGLAFASEIKALFASGLVVPRVDEEAVSAYLAHGFVPAPRTLYRGVDRLPPGCRLVADGEGVVAVERYWRARAADDLPRDGDAIAEHLVDLLRDSVRMQLRSDVPVGALLSGGIDSGLMVALAAEAAGSSITTYTVSFEGAAVDEAPLTESVAQRYATRHHSLRLPAAAAEHLPRLAWYCDEPVNDPALLPNALIEEVLGRDLKVALNGTGGDELFAGYGRYFPLAVEQRYLALPRWLRRSVVEPLAERISPMTAWRLRRSALFDDDCGRYLHDHSTHFPAPVRIIAGNRQPVPEAAQSRSFTDFEGPPQTAALYADIETYLPEDLLTLLDRTSIAVGVEGRVPYLDHRLVEAALAVPPEVRTPGNRQKALLRDIAARYLPKDVIAAPKQGFASPVPAWLDAVLEPLARRVLTGRRALERGWWTADGIGRLLADPRRHGFRVYTLLMLELSVRIHVESAPSSSAPADGLEAFADAD